MALYPTTRSLGACANCRRRLFWSPYGVTEIGGRLFCNVDCRWTWELKDGKERASARGKGGLTGSSLSGERWRRGEGLAREKEPGDRNEVAGLKVWEREDEGLEGMGLVRRTGEEGKEGAKVEWI